MRTSENTAEVNFCEHDFSLEDLRSKIWQNCKPISLDYYWSGVKAEIKRQTQVRLLWNDESLLVRFSYLKSEPLVINSNPNLTQKTILLWEKDVCEIFLAPDSTNPAKYYEFEVSPTGEWVDVAICKTAEGLEKDWEYHSKMKTASEISDDEIVLAMEIPWTAFSRKPQSQECWRGNLFRCCGEKESRAYLTWLPTLTELPNFHIPEKFGFFEFVK